MYSFSSPSPEISLNFPWFYGKILKSEKELLLQTLFSSTNSFLIDT